MPVRDIRPLKAALRERFKTQRREMPPEKKKNMDDRIAARLLALRQYRTCDMLLTYVSTPIEVDTYAIIRQALADGKVVAVPRCIPNTRSMAFHRITAVDQLSPGTFGVMEPADDPQTLVTAFPNSLCIVPALCYDWRGYRLGYGKGYYDRFLAQYDGALIGICYSDGISRKLPHGRFDRTVDLLVTEKYLRRTRP